MEWMTSSVFMGVKSGSIIAAIIGGMLRVIIRRSDGIINNLIGFFIGICVSLLCTDAVVQLLADHLNTTDSEALHTGTAAFLGLVGNDLCIAVMKFVKGKK
jgi:hypothetical protein